MVLGHISTELSHGDLSDLCFLTLDSKPTHLLRVLIALAKIVLYYLKPLKFPLFLLDLRHFNTVSRAGPCLYYRAKTS
jgi:hypothetical protein